MEEPATGEAPQTNLTSHQHSPNPTSPPSSPVASSFLRNSQDRPTPTAFRNYMGLPPANAVDVLLKVLDDGLPPERLNLVASMCRHVQSMLVGDAAVMPAAALHEDAELFSKLSSALSSALEATDLQPHVSQALNRLLTEVSIALTAQRIGNGEMGPQVDNDDQDSCEDTGGDTEGIRADDGDTDTEGAERVGLDDAKPVGGGVDNRGPPPVRISLQFKPSCNLYMCGNLVGYGVHVAVTLVVEQVSRCPLCRRLTARIVGCKGSSIGTAAACRSSGVPTCRYQALANLSEPDRSAVASLLLPVDFVVGLGFRRKKQRVITSRDSLREAVGCSFATSEEARKAALTAAHGQPSSSCQLNQPATNLSCRAQLVLRACRSAHDAEVRWRATPGGQAALKRRLAAGKAVGTAAAAGQVEEADIGQVVEEAAAAQALRGMATRTVEEAETGQVEEAEAGQVGASAALREEADSTCSKEVDSTCSLCCRKYGVRSKSKCSGSGTSKCIAAFRARAQEEGLLSPKASTKTMLLDCLGGGHGERSQPNSQGFPNLDAALGGCCHILLFGEPGTGKSRMLRLLADFLAAAFDGPLPSGRVQVVAAFGIVALNVGGVTLHSWAGLGHDEAELSDDGGKLSSAKVMDHIVRSAPWAISHWQKVSWLLIDEASLLSCELFDVLEVVARSLRKNDEFFGGIRLVMAFDFFQLFPVSPPEMPPGSRQPLFCSSLWKECVRSGLCVELTVQHRFANDDGGRLADLLFAARHGSLAHDHSSLLRSLCPTKQSLPTELQAVCVTLAPHRNTVRLEPLG